MIKSMQNKLNNIDELDLFLIKELAQNARLNYLEAASKLGVSHSTLRRRVSRLVNQNIVSLFAAPNFAALGYRTVLILAINVPTGTLDKVIDQFAAADSVKYLLSTSGRYDLMAGAMFRNVEEYIDSFPEEIGSLPPNVRIEPILLIRTAMGWPLNALDNYPVNTLSDLDHSVIKALAKFPMASVRELSNGIGASYSATRYSLNRLTSKEIVRVIGVPEPAALGYTVRGVVLIQAYPTSLKGVFNTLKDHPLVQQVITTLGVYNCIIWTFFQNSEQLSDFLTGYLSNIPGVMQFESLIALKIHKVLSATANKSSGLPGILRKTSLF